MCLLRWLDILKKREEISNQRRLAAQKARSSLPPVSIHCPSDLKAETESQNVTVQPSATLESTDQMQEFEAPLDTSTIEKQITHFTGGCFPIDYFPKIFRAVY